MSCRTDVRAARAAAVILLLGAQSGALGCGDARESDAPPLSSALTRDGGGADAAGDAGDASLSLTACIAAQRAAVSARTRDALPDTVYARVRAIAALAPPSLPYCSTLPLPAREGSP